MMSNAVLVAIGGNATHPENIRGTTEEQEAVAATAARTLLPLVQSGCPLLVTHGNGPVVGKILLRMMLTRDQIPPMRLDVCVAHSQGGIGYMLMQGFENEMRRAGIDRQVGCLLTQVEVDAHDPAFLSPSKPIGPFFTEAEAQDYEAKGWEMMEDSGRGWRHCVPSPDPKSIVHVGMIETMLGTGAVMIVGGGGGIPVVRAPNGDWQGVQAVVDKDFASALLARTLQIPTLLLLSGIDKVAVHFGKPNQRWLDTVTVSELKVLQQEGHFGKGSMGPKVEAAIRHIEGGGQRAIIAHMEKALPALQGQTGTHVVAG